jgi:tetratricopeptide (TPR) repeat protein
MQRLVLEKRYEDALRVLEAMAAAEPADPSLQYATGVVYYELERFGAAEKILKKIGPDSDFYENAAIHRAIMAYQADDTPQAISILETAMESAEAEAKVELIPYLSSFYQERAALGKAEELLREGLSMDPENTELRFELGALLDERGEHAAAIEQMKRVLDIDPDHADALNYLGYTYADRGIHLEKAESYIRKALSQKPDNGYILDSMGWVYYKTGRLEKALTYIEKAARLIPEDPIVREHLGDVYERLGKRQEALEAYRKALSLEPENPASIEAKIEALGKDGS